MSSVIVRRACVSDREAVISVVSDAFGRASEPDLVERIWASADYLPALDLVATVDDLVVGHVLNSRAQIGRTPVVALGPLAVITARQRTGIGSLLMAEVINRASALEETVIGLLGHPTYYPRFGFRRGVALGVQPPMPMPDDAPFMIRLLADARPPTGTFSYGSAFDEP